jgi:hypothetical protein
MAVLIDVFYAVAERASPDGIGEVEAETPGIELEQPDGTVLHGAELYNSLTLVWKS